ncbi:MAG: hypothetical protein ABEH56_05695 [Salinirussus sp.]
MTDPTDRSTNFATLFEAITGKTTLTEHQQIDIAVRYDDKVAEMDLSDYLDTAATAPEFDDVIDEHETY